MHPCAVFTNLRSCLAPTVARSCTRHRQLPLVPHTCPSGVCKDASWIWALQPGVARAQHGPQPSVSAWCSTVRRTIRDCQPVISNRTPPLVLPNASLAWPRAGLRQRQCREDTQSTGSYPRRCTMGLQQGRSTCTQPAVTDRATPFAREHHGPTAGQEHLCPTGGRSSGCC